MRQIVFHTKSFLVQIEFSHFAKIDFDEAIHYYSQIDDNLANRFQNEIRFSIDRIIYFPKLYAIARDNIRKCITHTFPYTIFYEIQKDTIYIYAVANHYKDFDIDKLT